jgi:DNA (cytosine-5)-methyltransferase 1
MACNAHGGPHGRQDFESEYGVKEYPTARALREGRIPEHQMVTVVEQNNMASTPDLPSLRAHETPNYAIAFSCKDHGADVGDIAPTLRGMGHDGSHANAGGQVAGAFDTTQITSKANRSNPKPGDACHPLASGARPPAVAMYQDSEYGVKEYPTAGALREGRIPEHQMVIAPLQPSWYKADYADAQEARSREILRSLREAVSAEAFPQWCVGVLASFQPTEILQSEVHGAGVPGQAEETDPRLDDGALSRPQHLPTGAMREVWQAGCERRTPQEWRLAGQLAQELGTYLSELPQQGTPPAWLLHSLWRTSEGLGLLRQALSTLQAVGRSDAGQAQPTHPPYAVRRLTPVECERLMGLPDNYTAIPWRGKAAEACPDGPRYKALGNSMAVPCMRWLGERIEMVNGLLLEVANA